MFTGANSRDTRKWFPRGEAVHNRERAIELGVPGEAVLVESNATNTGQNITFSRQVLTDAGSNPSSVMLICMPYMQRRAYATCRRAWPEVEVTCASESLTFEGYARRISDPPLALDMVVGDLQRIMLYPSRGFAIEQEIPAEVRTAYDRLVVAGFTSRLADN